MNFNKWTLLKGKVLYFLNCLLCARAVSFNANNILDFVFLTNIIDIFLRLSSFLPAMNNENMGNF